MQVYCFDADRFSSFEEAVKGKGRLRALSVLFEVIMTHKFITNLFNRRTVRSKCYYKYKLETPPP